MSSTKKYDYIIAGAGCAGLSLLVHMLRSGNLAQKKILLVDKEIKNRNDRTWCFWETTPGIFEPVVHHRWSQAWFNSDTFSSLLTLTPYQYKLIRGIDFYAYCFNLVARFANVEILTGEIQAMTNRNDEVVITVDGQQMAAGYIFSSVLLEKPVITSKQHYLLQHFKGWVIETSTPSFNPSQATLMDFRVSQERGTTFVYVMPFSATKALVEYTLFTADVLPDEEYNNGLTHYIQEYLTRESWKITEEETGVIPMTNYRFPTHDQRIIYIGTAGGQTKASSGYTFQFIQKHAAAIVNRLEQGRNPVVQINPARFRFYDNTLLHILRYNKLPGHTIFARLFQRNQVKHVLRFLDNESSLQEELSIISSLPTLPFLKAALKG